MSSANIGGLANRLMLLANILNTVKIEKLSVPETLSEESADAVLNCMYSGSEDSVLRWFLNGAQVGEWSPQRGLVVGDVLEGRLDLTYRGAHILPTYHQAPLKIMKITPELSGDYTCVVQSNGQEDSLTKTMIVYSPERDLRLDLNSTHIRCSAKRVFPQPELNIEYNMFPIAQQQRIWRNGSYFDAECIALTPQDISARAEVACRLLIPQVAYTAITKKYISGGKETNTAKTTNITLRLLFVSLVSYIVL